MICCLYPKIRRIDLLLLYYRSSQKIDAAEGKQRGGWTVWKRRGVKIQETKAMKAKETRENGEHDEAKLLRMGREEEERKRRMNVVVVWRRLRWW